jgi:hypothetical protein
MYGKYLTGAAKVAYDARMKEIADRLGIPDNATWYISDGTVLVYDWDRSQYVAVGSA